MLTGLFRNWIGRLINMRVVTIIFIWILAFTVLAQKPPDSLEKASYKGLFAAVVASDNQALREAIAAADDIDMRDNYHRTALHVAAYVGNHDAMRLLVEAGADPNALEHDFYDMVTIAAVANEIDTMKLALELGNKPTNITSRYEGTALIAAAHLGHVDIVKTLISAGAPLDHVNNLNWTALIESIVLGDGGEDHSLTLKALVDAGADVNITDGSGKSPLTLARRRGYTTMIEILRAAGARY